MAGGTEQVVAQAGDAAGEVTHSILHALTDGFFKIWDRLASASVGELFAFAALAVFVLLLVGLWRGTLRKGKPS